MKHLKAVSKDPIKAFDFSEGGCCCQNLFKTPEQKDEKKGTPE